jgi:hypothetical protein
VFLTRQDGTRVIGSADDRLSQRQQAVLDAIRASHPRPVTAAQLAAKLEIAEGGSTSPCGRFTAAD